MVRVLVIEDGLEYYDTLSRFLPSDFTVSRAGSGPDALRWLQTQAADVVYLDMRFDRAPAHELLGDLNVAAERFNGDPVAGRAFLEDHQGTYVLAALREAGYQAPVLISYDFSGEPKRLARLQARFSPVADLPDGAGPADVAARLRALAAGG